MASHPTGGRYGKEPLHLGNGAPCKDHGIAYYRSTGRLTIGGVEGPKGLTALTPLNECNRDLATFGPRTSRGHQVFLRKIFRVFEQLDDVVNDIVNFAAANDALGLEGKYPFNQLLHSFEVHYPIRFPRFTTVG